LATFYLHAKFELVASIRQNEVPKVGTETHIRGHARGLKGTRVPVSVQKLMFNSSMTHCLAAIHERDQHQPTNVVMTRSTAICVTCNSEWST